MRRADCSVFVGMPVDGPARCTSTMTMGSSSITARPIVSALRSMPGPLVAGTTSRPPNAAPSAMLGAAGRPERRVRGGDLVLGRDGAHAVVLVARELVEELGGRGDGIRREQERQ